MNRKELPIPKIVAKREKEKLRLLQSLKKNCEELSILSQYFRDFKAAHDNQRILENDYIKLNFAKQDLLKKTFSNKKILEMITE